MGDNTREAAVKEFAQEWKLFLEGDQDAFSTIFEGLSEPLFRYGIKFVPQPETIKDCIQDVFVKIYLDRNSLPEVENPRFYLMRALKNRIIDCRTRRDPLLRASSEELPFIVEEYEPQAWAEEEAHTRERFERVVALLSPRQREAIYLRFQQEMSYEEISQLLGINYQSTRNLIHRALEKVRSEMDMALFLALFIKYFL